VNHNAEGKKKTANSLPVLFADNASPAVAPIKIEPEEERSITTEIHLL
jgi:hypothetical protein